MQGNWGFISWEDVTSERVEGEKATVYYIPSEIRSGWGGNAVRVETRSFKAGRVQSSKQPGARVYVEYIPRRARKSRVEIDGIHSTLVILDGWGHPDPPDGWVPADDGAFRTRWTIFSPEWRREMDAFLTAYLHKHPTVRVLGDFRGDFLSPDLAKQPGLTPDAAPGDPEGDVIAQVPEFPSQTNRRPRPLAQSPPEVPHQLPFLIDASTFELMEKASHEHHELLLSLESTLKINGWQDIEEIPGAVDLWARHPRFGFRVIFEIKSVTPDNELVQTRHALAQLLEYRLVHGEPSDRLCFVGNGVLTKARVSVLEELGVAVLWRIQDRFASSGQLWRRWMTAQ